MYNEHWSKNVDSKDRIDNDALMLSSVNRSNNRLRTMLPITQVQKKPHRKHKYYCGGYVSWQPAMLCTYVENTQRELFDGGNLHCYADAESFRALSSIRYNLSVL